MFLLLTADYAPTPTSSRAVFEKVAQIFGKNREAETTKLLMHQIKDSVGFF
jgi:ABC-type enterochelin transport system substrate-binding protein